MRRILHVSEHLPWQETVDHLNRWSNCLRISGYSSKERYDTIRGAILRKKEMEKKVNTGEIKSLNRTRKKILMTKDAKGGGTAATWYLRGQTSSTIKCQPTPGGILASRLKKALNPETSKERVQVIEEGGLPISAGLRVNDPFRSQTCRYGNSKCIVESNKDCGTMGVVYEITCNNCQEAVNQEQGNQLSRQPGGQVGPNYIGMTMTSSHC